MSPEHDTRDAPLVLTDGESLIGDCVMNIDGFIAQYPDAEEIESTRRWSRWVSGDYDDYGHATDSGV